MHSWSGFWRCSERTRAVVVAVSRCDGVSGERERVKRAGAVWGHRRNRNKRIQANSEKATRRVATQGKGDDVWVCWCDDGVGFLCGCVSGEFVCIWERYAAANDARGDAGIHTRTRANIVCLFVCAFSLDSMRTWGLGCWLAARRLVLMGIWRGGGATRKVKE